MNQFDDAKRVWEALFRDPYTVKDGRTIDQLAREATLSADTKEEGRRSASKQFEADFEGKRSQAFVLYNDVTDEEQAQRDNLHKRRTAAIEKETDLQIQLDNLEKEEHDPSKAKLIGYGVLYLLAIVGGALLFAKTFDLVLPLPEWVGWVASLSTVVAFSIFFTILYQNIRSPRVRKGVLIGVVWFGLLVASATQVIFSAGREIASQELRHEEQAQAEGDAFWGTESSNSERQKELEHLGFWMYLTISLSELLFASALAGKLETIWKARKHKHTLQEKLAATRSELAEIDARIESLTTFITRKEQIGKMCEYRKKALSDALQVAYNTAWKLKEEEERRYQELRREVWGNDRKDDGQKDGQEPSPPSSVTSA